jgi:hypothetical protein
MTKGLVRRSESEKQAFIQSTEPNEQKPYASHLTINPPHLRKSKDRSPASTPVDDEFVSKEEYREKIASVDQMGKEVELDELEEDEARHTRYSRSALVLGIIIHLSSFIALSSIYRWPQSNPKLMMASSIFVGVNLLIGIIVFTIATSMALIKRLPKRIQDTRKKYYFEKSITSDVCPFTGDLNANQECAVCHTKVSYQVADISVNEESDPEDEVEPNNKILFMVSTQMEICVDHTVLTRFYFHWNCSFCSYSSTYCFLCDMVFEWFDCSNSSILCIESSTT